MSRRRGRPGLLAPVDLHAPGGGSLTRRGMISFAGLAFQGGLRLAVNLLIGRVAGAAVLGVVAAGQATAAFAILLWPATSGQAAARFLARARGRGDPAEIDAVARHLGRAFLVSTGLLAALSVPVSLARGVGPGQAACVAVFLAGLAGQQYTRGVHYGAGAVTRVVTWDIGLSALGVAGLAAALAAGVRDLRLLLPLAAGYLLLTLACWPWGPGPGTAAGRALSREIDAFVFFGSLGTIASAGLVQLSVIVAARLGDAEAGTYSAASSLAMPLTLLSGALSLVLYPSMAEASGRGDAAAVRAQLDRGVRGLAFLVVPLVAGLALLAPEVVELAYGPGFAASASLLTMLLLAVLVSMIAVPCVNAITSGRPRGIAETAAASLAGLAVAGLVWSLAAAPHALGVHGVAAGYLAGVATTGGYAIVRAWYLWRLRWWPVLGTLAGAVAGIAAAIALLGGSPWWARALAAVAAVMAWLAVMPAQRGQWLARLGFPARRGQRAG